MLKTCINKNKMLQFKIAILFLALLTVSCGSLKTQKPLDENSSHYLALGDSYTIGESVCETCNYPNQLADSLNQTLKKKVKVDIIAKTGWTTKDLINAIDIENPSVNYDFVTLLIGVNNQYQGQDFSIYVKEFPQLLQKAIAFAEGKKQNIMVISIPDYAYTPFGKQSGKSEKITKELNQYNAYAKKISEENNIEFINITDITRNGLKDPGLIAQDGLHPSKKAYKMFVDRIYTKVKKAIR